MGHKRIKGGAIMARVTKKKIERLERHIEKLRAFERTIPEKYGMQIHHSIQLLESTKTNLDIHLKYKNGELKI